MSRKERARNERRKLMAYCEICGKHYRQLTNTYPRLVCNECRSNVEITTRPPMVVQDKSLNSHNIKWQFEVNVSYTPEEEYIENWLKYNTLEEYMEEWSVDIDGINEMIKANAITLAESI